MRKGIVMTNTGLKLNKTEACMTEENYKRKL